jgi:5,10-methenyltetrahydrofolate synthetase
MLAAVATDDVKAWRTRQRRELIAARERLDRAALEAVRQRIDTHLWRAFPGLVSAKLGFCWPIRGEYDARSLAQRLRERGAVTALPVVITPGQPLLFREWYPGVALATDALGIPYPVSSDTVVPTAVLLPMNGWDQRGYRLGYGSGYFDRTLASWAAKPAVIGVSYELARMETIRPQSWDVPMDWVVTERGVYRRDPDGLAFLGAPVAGEPSALASPVCYAPEVDPRHFEDDASRRAASDGRIRPSATRPAPRPRRRQRRTPRPGSAPRRRGDAGTGA